MASDTMKTWEKIRFCFHDIWAPRDRLITLSVISTIFLLISSIVVSFGLAFGNQRINEYRIKRDPLAGAVLVGDEVHTQEQLSLESLSKFEKELAKEVKSLKGVFGFRAIVLSFEQGNSILRCTGRTAKKDDPFVIELLKSGCANVSQEPKEGEIISRKLMEAIGLREPPKELTIQTGQGSRKILVAAVVDELPYGWWFVLSEATAASIRIEELEAKVPVSLVTTGPVPAPWVNRVSELVSGEGGDYASIVSYASERNLRCEGFAFEEETKSLILEVRDSSSSEVPIGLVKNLLSHLVGRMPNATSAETQSFMDLSAPEITALRSNQVQPDYDMAGIYVSDYGDVVRVADLADTEPIFRRNVDRESAKKLKRSDEQTKTTKEIAASFAAILVVIASLGLLTTLGLRAARKIREVGMLRVMGFSVLQIALLWSIEALMIWCPSACGIPIGYLVGSMISKNKYSGLPCEAELGFSLTIPMVLLLVFSSLAATVLFMLLPLFRWQKKDAADLL